MKMSNNIEDKRKVVCLNTKEIFNSSSEASLKYNVDISSILSCCNGKRKSGGKDKEGKPLVWRKYLDYLNMNEHDLDLALSYKKVVCLNTGEIFDSTKEASIKYNIDKSNISSCCSGKKRTAGKLDNKYLLTWLYYKDYIKLSKEEINNIIIEKTTYKKVVCLNTGEIFKSITDASYQYNVKKSNISSCCSGKNLSAGKSKDGEKLKWRYYKDYLNLTKKDIEKIINNNKKIRL